MIQRFIAPFLFLLLTYTATAQSLDSIPSYDSVLAKVYDTQLSYSTLGMRSHMVWDDGSSQMEFQGNTRMQKDSIVWMSLTGPFNIEGARVLASPDTFRIINRLAGEYAIKEFTYLERWLYLKLEFNTLQQLLAGQKADIGEKATAVSIEDSMYVLYMENDKMQEKLWVHPLNYTITKLVLKDKMLKQSIAIKFEAYNDLNGKPFSYRRDIEINRDAQTMRLLMEINRATVNENLTYPFDVTDRLKRIEWKPLAEIETCCTM